MKHFVLAILLLVSNLVFAQFPIVFGKSINSSCREYESYLLSNRKFTISDNVFGREYLGTFYNRPCTIGFSGENESDAMIKTFLITIDCNEDLRDKILADYSAKYGSSDIIFNDYTNEYQTRTFFYVYRDKNYKIEIYKFNTTPQTLNIRYVTFIGLEKANNDI